MRGPLSGYKVIEIAQWWFVPAAGAVLADWGADVIKIEHPVFGDAQRGLAVVGWKSSDGNVDFMMQQSNRGKRSVGIDLGTPGGRELLYRLVEDADVFLTNFLPDARQKLEIDVEHIRARNPRILYARGTGQGPKGPDAEKGGYDATAFWSRGGVAEMLSAKGGDSPVMQRPAFGDSIGAMTLAGGIAAGLLHRERTGEAPIVDVSLLGTAMWVLSPDVVACKLVDPPKGLPPFHRPTAPNPVANPYKTKDERWIMLMHLQAAPHWADFCRHIGRPDMITDPRFADDNNRFENREACIRELDAVFAQHTLEEWRKRLATMTGPWAVMQSAAEVHDDPQASANGYIRKVDGGEKGVFDLVASPVQFDEHSPELGRSPELGEHTETVLLEYGLGWEQIGEYKRSKAII